MSSSSEVLAHLEDGTTLHFPEGTDPSIVQKSVKSYLSKPQTPEPQTGFKGLLQKLSGGPLSLSPEEQSKGREILSAPSTELGGKTTNADLVEGSRPFTIGPALAAGAEAASYTPGGPLAKAIVGGTAAAGIYLGADTALQKLKSLLSGSNEEPSLGSSALNL